MGDLQWTSVSQGEPGCQGKDYAQGEEMGLGLSGCCLHAVPAGGCQLGQDLGLAAGQNIDKVRASDQPDVVSSLHGLWSVL